MSASLPSARRHPSYGDCLEVKREYYQNCSVLGWHNVHSQQHTHMSSSYRSSRSGVSQWDAHAMHRGGCLELYYCNMVEWSWWDSSLTCKTNWFPSVLWHCWFGHMTCKIVPVMTYNVFGGTLNVAQSQSHPLTQWTIPALPCLAKPCHTLPLASSISAVS